jgi:hypothetical protein
MRKKQWFILVSLIIVIIGFLVYNSFSEVSPAFETAKTLAMTAVPDEDGDYIFGKKVVEKDIQMVYLVGYFPRLKIVSGAVATIEKMVSVIYDEETDIYGTTIKDMQTGRVLSIKSITRKEAHEMMGNILKHLVNNGIPI